jgi:dihydrofolate reductase
LEGILGVMERSEHPVAVQLQLTVMRLSQPLERLTVPGPGASQQICTVHLTHLPLRRSIGNTDVDRGPNWAVDVPAQFSPVPPSVSVVVETHLEGATSMGKIIVSENVTLDGGVKDPTGEEGTPRGGWFAQAGPTDRAAFGQAALEEALAADAFLMGRHTYEFLASRWPLRSGALADRLSGIPKYVVSATLQEPAWNNTRVIEGDAVTQVAMLKQQIPGEIVVPASFQLVHTLLEHDLVDELRITVYPVLLGTGAAFLGEFSEQVALRLVTSRILGDHLTHSVYEIARAG